MNKMTIGLLSIFAVATTCFIGYLMYKKNRHNIEAPIKHLGIIMDGNRRWAEQAGKAKWLGHKAGIDPLKTTIKFCLKHNIPYLTVYAWSLENFKRPTEEQDYLFNVLAKEVASKEFQEFNNHGVKMRFVGDRSKFPQQLVPLFEDIENKSKNNTALTLNILFCYGGQQEIVAAAKSLAEKIAAHKIQPSDITQEMFEQELWLGAIPAPDLIIRTGKVSRISGFLSYQSAYSELYFMDCYWPEVTEKHLNKALEEYKKHKRTFGK